MPDAGGWGWGDLGELGMAAGCAESTVPHRRGTTHTHTHTQDIKWPKGKTNITLGRDSLHWDMECFYRSGSEILFLPLYAHLMPYSVFFPTLFSL